MRKALVCELLVSRAGGRLAHDEFITAEARLPMAIRRLLIAGPSIKHTATFSILPRRLDRALSRNGDFSTLADRLFRFVNGDDQ